MKSLKSRKSQQTILILLAFCAMSAFQLSLGPTLPDLATQTNTQLDQVSIVLSAMFGGYLLGSFLNGKLYDSLESFRLVSIYLFIGAASLALIPLFSSLWVVTLLCFVMGFSSGAIDLGSNIAIVWIHGEKSGTFLNILHAFFGIGAFLVPLIIGTAVKWTGSAANGYWFIALLILPLAIITFFSTSPERVESQPKASSQRGSSFALIVFFAALMGCAGGTLNSISSWSFSYARARFPLMAEGSAYQLTSVLWATSTIVRILTLPLMSKIKARTFLLIDTIGSVASVLMIFIWNQNQTVMWIGTIGAGIFLATAFPQTLVYCNQLCGTSGKITRWLFLGQSTGNVIIPWIVGQFFITPGETSANLIHAIFLFGAFLALQAILTTSRKGHPDL